MLQGPLSLLLDLPPHATSWAWLLHLSHSLLHLERYVPRWVHRGCPESISPWASMSFRGYQWEGSPMAQTVKNLPAVRETWVRSLGREESLENGLAICLPGESLAGYSPWGSQSRTQGSDFHYQHHQWGRDTGVWPRHPRGPSESAPPAPASCHLWNPWAQHCTMGNTRHLEMPTTGAPRDSPACDLTDAGFSLTRPSVCSPTSLLRSVSLTTKLAWTPTIAETSSYLHSLHSPLLCTQYQKADSTQGSLFSNLSIAIWERFWRRSRREKCAKKPLKRVLLKSWLSWDLCTFESWMWCLALLKPSWTIQR